MTTQRAPQNWLYVTCLAAAILMLTMGVRQSVGLFVSPLNTATGLGIAKISFALAVGQFVWGAIQPVAGAISDKFGAGPVLVAGVVVLGTGFALTPWMTSTFGLTASLGILMSMGSGAGSFSVLIGAVIRRIPVVHRGMASGVVNAGGSLGQFIFAPVTQKLIQFAGWAGAMWSLAAISLLALPMIRAVGATPAVQAPSTATDPSLDHASSVGGSTGQGAGMLSALRVALQDRSYLLLHAGFFTCGFHIAFLVTHLPGEVALCGLPAGVASWSLGIIGLSNVVGSLVTGWWVQRYRSKYVLFWMYGSRALLVLAYLGAPKAEATFYVFAVGLGFTWLATVPPTAALVGKLFGNTYLATLFGLTLLSHQIGGFLGAWLGGLAISRLGDYSVMWWMDIGLAAAAAILNLPIREQPVLRPASVGTRP